MPGKLKDLLAGVLPTEVLAQLSGGYDIVGDVCLVKIPDELCHYSQAIGETLLAQLHKIRVVARICSKHDGVHRTVVLEKIAGDGDFSTIHHEFGLRLRVALDRVYFSPRSAQERYRVASQIRSDESVLVMFSGIGAMPLMIGRQMPSAQVYGIEINAEAHRCGLENLQLNRKHSANISLQQGDAGVFLKERKRSFTRIVMPLPLGAEKYLASSLGGLANKGHLHFYSFCRQEELPDAVDLLAAEIARHGRNLKEGVVHKCGLVSPRTFRICIDGIVEK